MSKDPKGSFKAHSNYIRAFFGLLHQPVPNIRQSLYDSLMPRFHQRNVLWNHGSIAIDLDKVRSSLNSAWGTEALLLMTGRILNEEELLRLSNNWSAIQTYYIFYYCTQALHIAKGHPRPENHPVTQRIFYDYWGARSIDLPPWSLAFGAQGAQNTPPGFVVDLSLHSWSVNEGSNTWNLAINALRTTRREKYEEKCREKRKQKRSLKKQIWKQQEASRISRGKQPRQEPAFSLPFLSREEKAMIDSQLRPYTVMDYLYRLRLRTNYADSNMFTDGPEDESLSRQVRNAFCRLASGTLFLHEIAIRELVHRDTFIFWVDQWIQRNASPNTRVGISDRRKYYVV